MTPTQMLERVRHMDGVFRIEPVRLGHAVNHYAERKGVTVWHEVYYVARMYASPKGNSAGHCRRWCKANGITLEED